MDIFEQLRKLMDDDCKLSEQPAASLAPEDVARFQEYMGRVEAFAKDLKRVKSKLDAERDRWLADMKDKHNLHGKNVHYDPDKGAFFERLCKHGD